MYCISNEEFEISGHTNSLCALTPHDPFIGGLIWQKGHLTRRDDCNLGESFVAEDDVSDVQMRQQGSVLQGSIINVLGLCAGNFVPLSPIRL